MIFLHRLLHYTPKICAIFVWMCASGVCFAQDPVANEDLAPGRATSSTTEKPIYTSDLERDNALLTKAFTAMAKADELQPLETPDEKIIALYKSSETRKQKGALLIMHAPDVAQVWPATLENLRRNLPLYGWATMTLPLPPKRENAIPDRELAATAISSEIKPITDESPTSAEAQVTPPPQDPTSKAPTSQDSESKEAKPTIARDKLIGERVEAGVEHLNKLGPFKLVALVDNSSAPDAMATLYKQISQSGDKIDGPLQAVILVNLQGQEPLSKEQLSKIFSATALPVMDIFFSPDNAEQAELRRQHYAEAMRKNLKDYQQLVLPAQPLVSVDEKQNFWLAKVHGFMTKRIEGSDASNDRPAQPRNLSALK